VPRWVELIIVGAAASVAGGLLLAPLLAWTRRYWRAAAVNRQEERLLRAFLEMAQDVSPNEIGATRLSARAAAIRANLRDPDPVLDRLVRKDHIRPDIEYPRHYIISSKGRARARVSPVVGVLRLAGPMTHPVPMSGSCARSILIFPNNSRHPRRWQLS
jgi:hypothetical protein